VELPPIGLEPIALRLVIPVREGIPTMGHAATIVAEYESLLWRTEDLVREFQPSCRRAPSSGP
jgi:hypothetical protein